MKILPLMIFILGITPVSARAQPELDLVLKGGPNATTLAKDNRIARYGVSGGLAGSLRWPLVDRFSLAGQMELLYTPRGAEATFEGEHLAMARYHYIDFTLVARPRARLGVTSVFLLLGGGLNYLLSASLEDAAGAKMDVTKFARRVDMALIFGAGGAIHLPARKLGPFRLGTIFLEARHDRGLIDTDTVLGGARNRSSSLMLGLSFALASRAPNKPPAPSPAPGAPPGA